MPGPVDETGVVKSITKAIKKNWPHAWHLNVHGHREQRRGVPDLIFCIEGHFIAFEVKHQKPGESAEHAYGRTSTHQQKELTEVYLAGGLATTVLTAQEAVDLIEHHLAHG